ncbi:hypothetical protein GvMRE_I1g709 [endosymbiont GvMRE of Glomus versiforme]|nr:hypothetical protein GvMRE_I1g709 [endosymbiont GvMRE of Glomus versiforme]
MKEIEQEINQNGVLADHEPQRLNMKGRQKMPKRIKKICTACDDSFTCYQKDNYDYCPNCPLNNSRYAQNQCPECGDGSGWIKFPNQPLRACKLCSLQPKIIQKEVHHG